MSNLTILHWESMQVGKFKTLKFNIMNQLQLNTSIYLRGRCINLYLFANKMYKKLTFKNGLVSKSLSCPPSIAVWEWLGNVVSTSKTSWTKLIKSSEIGKGGFFSESVRLEFIKWYS